MAVPSWPAGVPHVSLKDGFDNKPFLPPIKTEMESGDMRIRSRPGDNVAVIQQIVPMSRANYETLKTWGKETIGNWSGRFSVPVWLGSSYETKVCQFSEGAPRPTEYAADEIGASMTLRVYDV